MQVSITPPAEAARARACPHCGVPAGEPCSQKPVSDHLLRFAEVRRQGLITEAEMGAALALTDVVTAGTLIRDGAEWRPVAGTAGRYEVSSDGEVWSKISGRLLKPSFDGHYLGVQLQGADRDYRRRVHKLVAEAFIGPCPEGQEVRHWNGDHLDNHAANLLYGTMADNREDSIRLGTIARGDRVGGARLTDALVREIRKRYAAEDATCASLAAEYGVSEMTISRAVRGQTWGHVEMPDTVAHRVDWRRGEGNPNAKLTEFQVLAIRQRYAAGGVTQVALAAEFGLHKASIYQIIRGKSWGGAL